jgi:hypothetical protein
MVMSFLSGLYFRGKLGYANAFAPPHRVLVITTNRGLLPATTRITIDDLARFAETDIHHESEAFIGPLVRDEGTELTYVPVRGASRHGERPPKLTPRHRHRRRGT